jgi:hypothetical protein
MSEKQLIKFLRALIPSGADEFVHRAAAKCKNAKFAVISHDSFFTRGGEKIGVAVAMTPK